MTLPDPPRRGLIPHLVTCFTGAANDNLFRQVIGVSLVALAVQQSGTGAEAARRGELYVICASIAFLVPFVLLAPLAGALGDRLPRHLVLRTMRAIEVPMCVLGAIGFWLQSLPLMLASLAGLAMQSAVVAPIKLAMLPDLVPPRRMANANAVLQAVTLVAIVGGTGLAFVADAGVLSHLPFPVAPGAAVMALSVAMAVVGLIAAWRVPAMAAAAPTTPLRFFNLMGALRGLRSAPGLFPPALSLALFWGLGVAAQAMILPAAEQAYHAGQAQNPLFQLALVAGIVIGSLLAPRLSTRAYPAGLPLLGAMIAASGLLIAGLVAHHGGDRWWFGIWVAITGVGAGLWEVPLQVLVLERAPVERRNQVQAAAGILGSLVMIAATLVCAVFTQFLDLRAARVLSALGAITFLGGLGFAWYYRHQATAWAISRLVKLAYRVRVVGAEHFPASGGCLVICNHLSYADGLILAACLPRPGRFLVYRRYVDMPVVGWLLRAAGVIPVASEDRRNALLASIDAAVAAAQAGEAVVIFPEGKLTRGGQLDTFRGGMERIARRAGVPIVPVHLHGLWGTVASRSKSYLWPRLFRPVDLHIGPHQPADTPAVTARDHVMHLSYEQAQARADRDGRTLGTAVLRQAKLHPRHVAVHDAGGTITTLQLAAMAQALVGKLGLAADETRVGVLLPPGRGGAIVNVALAIAGRTAVNLNHTSGAKQVARMIEMAGVRTIITAGIYLRRIGGDLELSQRLVHVEEVLPTISKVAIVWRMALTLLLPARWLARSRPADVAAIIFSSGSTGDPKGVELTHRQILANCDGVAHALHLEPGKDVVLNPLPLFHSFGLIPGTWLGLVLGMRVAHQPDPTDATALGLLAEQAAATFLLSTPTFVRGYLRRVEPAQFRTLRLAVVGAERCPNELKVQFKERYGSDLLEGYGCTELAPVVSINLPTVERDGVTEVRSRDGAVGRPLPGIHVLAVDPETLAPQPTGSEGLLVVLSAARMRGYLDRQDLTEKAFIHGGYNTGDIGRIDADGFIFITGRLARFAKIAGEMVPLDNIETALATIAGTEIEVAVAAVSDPVKGERVLVLHTGYLGTPDVWFACLESFPALWRPKAKDVHLVDAIPKLGTGKRDLAGIKRLAAERAG